MGKHTINIRVVIDPLKSIEENDNNLKKTSIPPRKNNLTVETPLTGTNRYDKLPQKDSPKSSHKLIK